MIKRVEVYDHVFCYRARELMVPLYERRYRIYEEEIPIVIASPKLLSEELLQTRDNNLRAETILQVLYRLMKDSPERPRNPKLRARDYMM